MAISKSFSISPQLSFDHFALAHTHCPPLQINQLHGDQHRSLHAFEINSLIDTFESDAPILQWISQYVTATSSISNYYISSTTSVLLQQYYYISTTTSVLLHQYYYISTTTSVLLHQYYYISTTTSVLLH
jgi:hypothetical protein